MRWCLAICLLVSLAFLAGCGEDDPFKTYCGEVKDQQKPLTEALAGTGPTALIDALPAFRELREVAPDDLADEWQTLVTRVETLVTALDEAGVDPATYDRDDPPAGLTDEERTAIDAAARELTAPATVAAQSGVEQQARDVCKMPLFL